MSQRQQHQVHCQAEHTARLLYQLESKNSHSGGVNDPSTVLFSCRVSIAIQQSYRSLKAIMQICACVLANVLITQLLLRQAENS